jgi:integrase
MRTRQCRDNRVWSVSERPQRTVMEILGHKDPRMTLRYQHLLPDHLRRFLHALEQPVPSEPSKEIVGIKSYADIREILM